MRGSTSVGYDQFVTSPEAIEQELRPAVCERRPTDRLKANYSIDVNISTGSSSDSQSSATTIRLSSSGGKHDLLWGLNVGDLVQSIYFKIRYDPKKIATESFSTVLYSAII